MNKIYFDLNKTKKTTEYEKQVLRTVLVSNDKMRIYTKNNGEVENRFNKAEIAMGDYLDENNQYAFTALTITATTANYVEVMFYNSNFPSQLLTSFYLRLTDSGNKDRKLINRYSALIVMKNLYSQESVDDANSNEDLYDIFLKDCKNHVDSYNNLNNANNNLMTHMNDNVAHMTQKQEVEMKSLENGIYTVVEIKVNGQLALRSTLQSFDGTNYTKRKIEKIQFGNTTETYYENLTYDVDKNITKITISYS